MEIKDGTGSGSLAGVSLDNRLEVSARQEERIFYSSRDDGQAFTWVTATSTLAANDTLLLIKNTSKTKNLFIDSLLVTMASASVVTVHRPATVATPTGTAVAGTNLNGNSANTADATAIKDETTNALTVPLLKYQAVAATPIAFDLKGAVILGPDQSIAVDTVATQASFECKINGWFEAQ